MRRALLLVAAGCLLGLSQPASAYSYYITVSLSRPNTGWVAFFSDRNECLSGASHRQWHTADAMGPGTSGGGSYVTTAYDAKQFSDCMAERGYRLDPNGYHAVWILLRKDGRYFMGGL